MRGERGPSQKKHSAQFHLYEVPREVKFIEKLQRRMPGAGATGEGKLLFNGYKVSVILDEKSSGH